MTRIERSWARVLELESDFAERDATFLATEVVRLDQELKRLREEFGRMSERIEQLERDVAGEGSNANQQVAQYQGKPGP